MTIPAVIVAASKAAIQWPRGRPRQKVRRSCDEGAGGGGAGQRHEAKIMRARARRQPCFALNDRFAAMVRP